MNLSTLRILQLALCSCVMPAGAAYAQSHQDPSTPAATTPAEADALPAAKAVGLPAPEAESAARGGIADIIVTARRTNESAQSVPLAISVLDKQKLVDTNVTGLADVAKITPGFFVQTSSADPTGLLLTIRGQSQQDSILTTDSPIGVYVDGVNYIRSSNLETTLVDIDRVEVLKGPQGTLYGKNTTGGAISITTRQPDLKRTGGFIDVVGGNYGRLDVTGVLNLPLVDDVLGVRIMAQRLDHDSIGHDGLGRGLGDKREHALRANILFKPSPGVRLAISGDYTLNKSNGPLARLAFVSPFPSLAPGSPSVSPALFDVALASGLLNPALLADQEANAAAIGGALFQAQKLLSSYVPSNIYYSGATSPQGVYARTYGVSANLAIDLTPDIQFRSISAERWLKRDEQVDLDGSPFVLLEADLRSHAKNLSQEFQLASSGAHRLNWILGAYANKETGQDGSTAVALRDINPGNPNITDGTVKNSSWAGFGQAVYAITDAVRLTGGLRWTEEKKVLDSRNRAGPGGAICSIPVPLQVGGQCLAHFDNKFSDYSYLASLDWKPTGGVLLYARTARGFKGGGENLRGSGSDESFAPFRPEIVTDYEVGLKSDFLDRHLRVNGDVYYANYKDIQRTIVQAAASGAIVSLVTNAAKARIQGAELEVTAIPVQGLTLSASGSITDAKYKKFVDATGDRSGEPFQFPKYSYSLIGTYAVPTSFGEARLSVDYNWRSRTQLVSSAIYRSTLSQPAYGLLGGRFTAHLSEVDTDLSIFAKNLTNRKYSVSGVQFDNSLGFNSLYAGEPRMYGVQLTTHFGGG